MTEVLAVRQRLFATTWFVLSAQLLIVALGTVQVCADRPHAHGGVPTPGCTMHHHPSATDNGGEHSHHGHATPVTTAATGAQIACRCSDEPPSTYLGQVAVLAIPVTALPFVQASLTPVSPVAPATDHRFTPPSPPPR